MATPKPKLRWFQYSLRTLLVFVTLCSIPCSWLAVKLQQARRQREAVEAIEKLGGAVEYDWQFSAKGTYLSNPQLRVPMLLRSLLGDDLFQSVPSLVLTDKEVTDAVLEQYLRGLSQLHWLNLGNTQVTDAGLEHLKGLSQLQGVSLDRTQVTDAGLENLKSLSELNVLFLSETQVTDAGLERLKGLSQLRALALNKTQITDVGLEHIRGLSQLQALSIRNTHVTDAGVKELGQALPNCKIYHGFARLKDAFFGFRALVPQVLFTLRREGRHHGGA